MLRRARRAARGDSAESLDRALFHDRWTDPDQTGDADPPRWAQGWIDCDIPAGDEP